MVCSFSFYLQIAGAMAEKGCSLDEVAATAQEVADSIGMIEIFSAVFKFIFLSISYNEC